MGVLALKLGVADVGCVDSVPTQRQRPASWIGVALQTTAGKIVYVTIFCLVIGLVGLFHCSWTFGLNTCSEDFLSCYCFCG